MKPLYELLKSISIENYDNNQKIRKVFRYHYITSTGRRIPLYQYILPSGDKYNETPQAELPGPTLFIALTKEDGEILENSIWKAEEIQDDFYRI
jgi:hypothetical protein